MTPTARTLKAEPAVEVRDGALILRAGLRLVNETNAREHWAARARRAKQHREMMGLLLRTKLARDWLRRHVPQHDGEGNCSRCGCEWDQDVTHECPPSYAERYVVTITRVGKRRSDDDGIAASAKHCRDGIAAVFGLDDADARWDWRYGQRCDGRYAVEVEIRAEAR